MKKKTNLGPEYDVGIRDALISTLASLGATCAERNWAVGGSQEVEMVEFLVDGNPLTVESETYIGLTISGEEDIVDAVAARVREELRK